MGSRCKTGIEVDQYGFAIDLEQQQLKSGVAQASIDFYSLLAPLVLLVSAHMVIDHLRVLLDLALDVFEQPTSSSWS
jgi:hypothetical protein